MNAKTKTLLSQWDREERTAAVSQMCTAIEDGDLQWAGELLAQFPLLDHFVPFTTHWSHLAAAAGQWDMLNFWRQREKNSGGKQPSLESLLFWAMGNEYVKAQGDPLNVAAQLLDAGADIEGDLKDYPPLHRAIFMNRPNLVEFLIQRGARLNRAYATGESVLQIALRRSPQSASLLQQAGAPLELPKKKPRPKPIATVDLRQSAKKLSDGLNKAIQKFARRHGNDFVTAIALASIPHEGYVMVSFDTGKFEGSPWDAAYSEFAWIKFPDWSRAFKGDQMHLIDLAGQTRLRKYNEDEPQFVKMIVATLQSLQLKRAFAPLKTTKNCVIGVEMTNSGRSRFWKLSQPKKDSKR